MDSKFSLKLLYTLNPLSSLLLVCTNHETHHTTMNFIQKLLYHKSVKVILQKIM